MLMLKRRLGEGVTITLPDGERIRVRVVKFFHGDGPYGYEQDAVRLAFEARPAVTVNRDEVQEAFDNHGSAQTSSAELEGR